MEETILRFCTICKKNFDINLYDEHCKIHSKSCKICGMNLTRKDSLKRHVQEFHKDNEKKFKCDIEGCESKFKRKDHLNTHKLLIHKPSKLHKCHNCNRSFNTKSNKNKHLVNVCKGILNI